MSTRRQIYFSRAAFSKLALTRRVFKFNAPAANTLDLNPMLERAPVAVCRNAHR